MPLEPAPTKAARQRQLSLFGVEAGDPATADLAGLLAGPGEVVRMGGTARVSVTVDAAWRVHVLAAEFARRGLPTSWLPAPGGGYGVRTAYPGLLSPLAGAWLKTGGKRPPARFHLNGHRLRLWVAAAGAAEPLGFLLRLGAADEMCWETVGAALAAIGLPAVLVTPRIVARVIPAQAGPPAAEALPEESEISEKGPEPDGAPPERGPASDGALPEQAPAQDGEEGAQLDYGDGLPPPEPPMVIGPAYRITGRRRLSRLAEIVGDRPAAAPPHAWPVTGA